MSEPEIYTRTETSPSVAWARTFLTMRRRPSRELSPFVVSIAADANGQPVEDVDLRHALNACLEADGQQSIETVAKTIFPQEMWRRAKGDGVRLYKDYTEYLPDFVSMEPDLNAQGLYFARLIGYGINHKDGTPLEYLKGRLKEDGNQLEFIIHRNHLSLLERMMENHLAARLGSAGSMQWAFDLIRTYPSIGDFLAYQYVTDVNYSDVTGFTEMEFVVAGPGAVDGIRKCFVNTAGLNDAEVIRFMADRQEIEFERLGLKFRDLWGRRLQLIDCQNLFCEVGKYARVSHPDSLGRSGRTRIKQRFRPNPEPIDYWYPPKWRINHALKQPEETTL
jgi:alpha-glutamyl/putrescinyl thymine pyrophosphorylase clade 1